MSNVTTRYKLLDQGIGNHPNTKRGFAIIDFQEKIICNIECNESAATFIEDSLNRRYEAKEPPESSS